ncbi:14357_t:CDS:1, partial [Racocetra persica]
EKTMKAFSDFTLASNYLLFIIIEEFLANNLPESLPNTLTKSLQNALTEFSQNALTESP